MSIERTLTNGSQGDVKLKKEKHKNCHTCKRLLFLHDIFVCVSFERTHSNGSQGDVTVLKRKRKKSHTFLRLPCCMQFLFYTLVRVSERSQGRGWLRLIGSLKVKVSNAKEPYKRDDIMQKRPIILRSLLIEATP